MAVIPPAGSVDGEKHHPNDRIRFDGRRHRIVAQTVSFGFPRERLRELKKSCRFLHRAAKIVLSNQTERQQKQRYPCNARYRGLRYRKPENAAACARGSNVKGSSTIVNLGEESRKDSLRGLDLAADDKIPGLKAQLVQLQQKIKQEPEKIKIVRATPSSGLSTGGGAAFGILDILLLLGLLALVTLRRRPCSCPSTNPGNGHRNSGR